MGSKKKKRSRGGANVRVIRVKKQSGGYEPPVRQHSTSTNESDRKQHATHSSGHLFDGFGALDLDEKENMRPSVKSYANSLKRGLPAATTVTHNPIPITRAKGLTNLGNTCYFNSVLQILSHTKLLKELLSEIAPDGQECEAIHIKNMDPGITAAEATGQRKESDSVSGKPEDEEPENLIVHLPAPFEIFNCVIDTLRDVRSGPSQVFTPNRLLNALGRKCFQFRGRDQQDSHELLRTLLDVIRTDEMRRKRKALLNRLGIAPAHFLC